MVGEFLLQLQSLEEFHFVNFGILNELCVGNFIFLLIFFMPYDIFSLSAYISVLIFCKQVKICMVLSPPFDVICYLLKVSFHLITTN
jgi:hypothetical protein